MSTSHGWLPGPARSEAAPGRRLRVLLCEPYLSGSHRAWAERLVAHTVHDVRLASHHGAFWKWRMQGSALTLAEEIRSTLASSGPVDVLVVSDMTHLPALLGFLRRDVGDVPVVLYLHENQLTYPLADGAVADHTYAMTNWLSLQAADVAVFNSEHHRRDLLTALPRFLRRFPDHGHAGFLARLRDRTAVLPVGIDADRFAGGRGKRSVPTVLWCHRWEHDKDPAAFFSVLGQLADEGLPFGLILAGERFAAIPPAFAAARERFADRLVRVGTATPTEYPRWLLESDVVVSTARHEFFGVAVVEAMAAGAFPVLPHGLSYPELVPEPLHRSCLYDSPAALADLLRRALTDGPWRTSVAAATRAAAQRFDWRHVAPRYDRLLEDVVAGRVGPAIS